MQSLPRRWEGTLLLVLLVLCGTGRGRAAATDGTGAPRDQDTNVIMVSVDTLRHDHLGCYGYPRNTSPNIDRLAGQSVVFERYVSQAILTPVSQMSIFTAQYPRVNGVVSFQPALDVMQSKTLAEILKAYGFVTAAFLGSPEFQDERYGGQPGGDGKPRGLFSRSFDVYQRSRGGFRSVPEDALQWVRENKDSRFFLWLPIGTVHWPYSGSVPAPYRTQFDPPGYTPFFDTTLPGRRGGTARDAVHADVLSYIYKGRYYAETDRVYTLSDADREFIVARYDAGIFYADLFVGRLLTLLDQLDIGRKTLIVLYSTHGEDLGEHGYFGHYDLYDTETRNALLIRFPENRYGGQRFAPQVQGIDIVPTVLNYLDIPVHHGAQGVSLLPEIAGKRPATGTEFAYVTRTPIFEYVLFQGRRLFVVATRKTEVLGSYMELLAQNLAGFDPQRPPYDLAVRTVDWKLIVRGEVPVQERVSWWRFVSGTEVAVADVELYDLRRDPTEQVNVAAEHPDTVAWLKGKLSEWDAGVRARAAGASREGERLVIPYP